MQPNELIVTRSVKEVCITDLTAGQSVSEGTIISAFWQAVSFW